VTKQRNRELEAKDAYLRGKLVEAGDALHLPPVESMRTFS